MKCEGRREKSKITKTYLLYTLSQKILEDIYAPSKWGSKQKKKIQQGHKNPEIQHKRQWQVSQRWRAKEIRGDSQTRTGARVYMELCSDCGLIFNNIGTSHTSSNQISLKELKQTFQQLHTTEEFMNSANITICWLKNQRNKNKQKTTNKTNSKQSSAFKRNITEFRASTIFRYNPRLYEI